jgi:hypothetical protein
MAKYCCFNCPQHDYGEKALSDLCPSCGKPYGFVLTDPPHKIGRYVVKQALDRGFYGAAYVAEADGMVAKKYVIKISPRVFYDFFKKPTFKSEIELHNRLAESATHIVGLVDAFKEDITFGPDGGTTIPCYASVLNFVEGPVLREFFNHSRLTNAATLCQIVTDLLQIRSELEAAKLNHNDLHAGNLVVEILKREARRPDAIDPLIRVMAIDLGSLGSESKSTESRLGDLKFICEHVGMLIARLLSRADELDDRDYRVTLALQGLVNGFSVDVQNQRVPAAGDIIDAIRQVYYRAAHHWAPWRTPLSLRDFGDHYNAQTLESWDVPSLRVDPDDRWLREITRPGPQIITGMRGCGKTMLLRGLDVHARAAKIEGEKTDNVIARIQRDGFVGLYVSAQRLLDLRGQALLRLEQRLSRLFVAYALQAVRALMHLRDIDESQVSANAKEQIGIAVSDYLEGGADLGQSISLDDLEARLTKALVRTVRGDAAYVVNHAPAEVFTHLAEALRSVASPLRESTVLYLLDDVSTRYLDIDRIEAILSALLFQSPTCAFKFTSEWQTIELGLKSPGRNHPIREGRDLTVFDLGADVFKIISKPGNAGKRFVANILEKRAKVHARHPRPRDPKGVLGDVTLEDVAREIGASNEGAAQKKRVYRGLSCLTSVCVGDIGDVIKLYEEILRRANGSSCFPVDAKVQSECFQEMAAKRLYDLNRRDSSDTNLKNHALAFAETSHDLLVRSFRNAETGKRGACRLRQYSSIYVRVTTEDETSQQRQIDRLRELIDAGVFVFAGGAPRTKTKDSDPIQQFILSFRKIYGLSSYIGLADRDRFELSGRDLSAWLDLGDVKEAKKILIRNQLKSGLTESGMGEGGDESAEEDVCAHNSLKAKDDGGESSCDAEVYTAPLQRDLFESVAADNLERRVPNAPSKVGIQIEVLSAAQLSSLLVGAVILGLGFEDRTLAASQHLAAACSPQSVYMVRYAVAGRGEEIRDAWKAAGNRVELPEDRLIKERAPFEGVGIVDVSGLSKPIIFSVIRRELLQKGEVIVCHAMAQEHYPLEADLESVIAAKQANDPADFLDRLSSVLKGEKGPYTEMRLLNDLSDPSRNRALLAFASPKHERLFSLMDRREFDKVEIIAPDGDTPRARVSRYAADFVKKIYPNAEVRRFGTDDLLGLVRYLDTKYIDVYGMGGANLELGLTGSKSQAVAAAILSAVRRVSQVWYLKPAEYDHRRFSSGVGEIRMFRIRVGGNQCDSA